MEVIKDFEKPQCCLGGEKNGWMERKRLIMPVPVTFRFVMTAAPLVGLLTMLHRRWRSKHNVIYIEEYCFSLEYDRLYRF